MADIRCRNDSIKWIFYILCVGIIMFCLGWWMHNTSDLHNCLMNQILYGNDDKRTGLSNFTDISQYLASFELNSTLPTIFFITPTYHRAAQKAELTRLCQTLMHVKNLHWILVEDSNGRTPLVTRFLNRCPVQSTQLYCKTSDKLQAKKIRRNPGMHKNRGSEQRNAALDWLNSTYKIGQLCGVVYFGDDDNTYDLKLFDEMRYTKKVSVWPVGLVGGLLAEGPTCKDGKVIGWHVGWSPSRKFPIDMAAFAVNLDVILKNPQARLKPFGKPGYLEPDFLSHITTVEELEAKADDCTKVYVWHTQTKRISLKYEKRIPTQMEVK